MYEELSLRERKKLKTRNALVAAALRLFNERGYSDTTVDDIVAAVDVSRRTFFRYFASKEDVLFFDSQEYIELFREALETRTENERVVVTAKRAALAIARELKKRREEVLARMKISFSEPTLIARYLQLLHQWRVDLATLIADEEGEDLTSSVHPWLVAGALLGPVDAGLSVWTMSGGESDIESLFEESFAMLQRGLGFE